ncbi:MAG: DUF2254 domain-containing protein [Dehalococcoidia bacterium]|nr:DUF2254 domain-containing protein [Dehalococcoidia bacterium]
MNLKLTALRERLRSSLWFLPAACAAGAFILAESAVRIDRTLDGDRSNWFLFGGGVESARAVVSTIATSMLTFTGLVFSVTMLVLQLASNQLSPRVMRTFLRDRANQLVLGVFVATFLYSLLVLRRVTNEPEAEPFVPALSVWLALLLVLLSLATFIYYIDHVAQSIKPVAVMQRVTSETTDAIRRLYPDSIGESVEEPRPVLSVPVSAVVLSMRSGVVTGVDEDRIIAAARETGCVVGLRACVGDFVREGAALFEIRGEWDGTGEASLQESVSFGPERTMEQDAAFGIRQLVDIADRALSPGVNDPTTAVQVIDHIHEILGHLVSRSIPGATREVDGSVVAILPRPGWDDYVALSCDEIRRAGRGQMQIQRRMRAMLVDLLTVAPPGRRGALEEQLALLDADLGDGFADVEAARATTPSAQGHGPIGVGGTE